MVRQHLAPPRQVSPAEGNVRRVDNTLARKTLMYLPKEYRYFLTVDVLRDGLKICGAKLTFEVVNWKIGVSQTLLYKLPRRNQASSSGIYISHIIVASPYQQSFFFFCSTF